ncbi:nucleotidyltransferase domain-containing protein [Thermanaerothrix sp.]|jgi:predicted nucleotidyltransferase|uniref:nucleotidyltransferase domain-containing protein n=1 Tax=Thermanaerothrix sp. TaxID=2972675 RepID=UPI002ADD93B0|nr:nucleotidyltransferase domain-containing protein [Thermanaerothrix sp.]
MSRSQSVAPTGFPPVAETLPQVIERLVQVLKPYKIILFGSYAYGTPTPDSDVDLLIIWDAPADRRKRVALISQALTPRLFPVDVISKTPQELEQELPHNFMLREILHKGKVLYER